MQHEAEAAGRRARRAALRQRARSQWQRRLWSAVHFRSMAMDS